MATFGVDIFDVTENSAKLHAFFYGGVEGYANYRYIKIWIDGNLVSTVRSRNPGSSESYFDTTITGLFPGTSYDYYVVLCYVSGNSDPIETDYSKSGVILTLSRPKGRLIYIGNSRGVPERYVAYIGNRYGQPEPYAIRIGPNDL